MSAAATSPSVQREPEMRKPPGTASGASGNSVYDPALRGTWISRTEAEEHAEKITRDYMKAQGYPEATDSPDWQDSN
jgi:hypothetical protein